MRRGLKRRGLVLAALLSIAAQAARGNDAVYEGLWKTTNRKLDGTMTCVVTSLGPEKWSGRFYGVWQGVPFDYTVPFTGPPDNLRGTATIDGAHYDWIGVLSDEAGGSFKGTFGGNRYTGSFDLKPKAKPTAARPSHKPEAPARDSAARER
jgi:hypothetical protein